MMILQRRHIVVANRQLRPGIDLITDSKIYNFNVSFMYLLRVVVARMIDVVAYAGGEKNSKVDATHEILKIAQMNHSIHLKRNQ